MKNLIINETLLYILNKEYECKFNGDIYDKMQIEFTYNSNHIEGNNLEYYIVKDIYNNYKSNLTSNNNVDDVIKTVNHFRCIDICIKEAKSKLSELFYKKTTFNT